MKILEDRVIIAQEKLITKLKLLLLKLHHHKICLRFELRKKLVMIQLSLVEIHYVKDIKTQIRSRSFGLSNSVLVISHLLI